MKTTPPPLDYAKAARGVRRRFNLKVVIWTSVSIFAVFAGMSFRDVVQRRLSTLRWQSDALRWSAPPSKLIMDSAITWDPRSAVWGNSPVFSHERHVRGGDARLVGVHVRVANPPGTRFNGAFRLDAVVFQPGGFTADPTLLSDHLAHELSGPRIKVYAGQIDANDPSHFTIRIETDGVPKTLDGWLDASDRVTIELRK